jgi:hypothetical protein
LSHLSNIADSIALNLKNTNLTVERMKYWSYWSDNCQGYHSWAWQLEGMSGSTSRDYYSSW